MSGMEAAIPALISVIGQAAPLMTKGDEPNQAFMSQAPSSRNVRQPQGMGVPNQQQSPDQTLQMLMGIMASLAQMQGGQTPGGQPGAPPTAQPPQPGPQAPQGMGVL